MRSKRFLVVAALLCAALVTAGIAIAKGKPGGIAPSSATINAATVTESVQKTCKINGGDTYAFTHATYTGAAVSTDARLMGPITIKAWSIVDVTTGNGALVGHFKIDGAGHGHADGKLQASLSGGQASGSARAHVGAPGGELFAGLNGGFTTAGGFINVALGSGGGSDSGVVLAHGACVHNIPLDY